MKKVGQVARATCQTGMVYIDKGLGYPCFASKNVNANGQVGVLVFFFDAGNMKTTHKFETIIKLIWGVWACLVSFAFVTLVYYCYVESLFLSFCCCSVYVVCFCCCCCCCCCCCLYWCRCSVLLASLRRWWMCMAKDGRTGSQAVTLYSYQLKAKK